MLDVIFYVFNLTLSLFAVFSHYFQIVLFLSLQNLQVFLGLNETESLLFALFSNWISLIGCLRFTFSFSQNLWYLLALKLSEKLLNDVSTIHKRSIHSLFKRKIGFQILLGSFWSFWAIFYIKCDIIRIEIVHGYF